MKGWLEHDGGEQPARTKGKRVIVQLRSGKVCGREPVTSTSPPGWTADAPTRWKWEPEGSPARTFDIVRYMIV